MEADVYPKNKPERWNVIDGAIGELSPFHETFGYYAKGVEEGTATLPAGWKERLVLVSNAGTRFVKAWCLETHDLVLSKYVAGREKDRLVWEHGLPESLRVDNGPEFISTALDRWAFAHGVALHFIQPGKPVQNAHVESFNGHFRDECLSQAHWPTVARARVEAELWRVDYNCVRPHSSLRYETPKAFGDRARLEMPPSAGAAAAFLDGSTATPSLQSACELREERIEVS